MRSIRTVAFACMVSALMALPLTAAAQGPANQDTFFTFSQAVELPGKTLPAGKYFFQLMDSPSNRHIVKVMSEDRKQLHATLLAIPYYSTDRPSDKPEVRFMETPAQASGGAAGTNAIKIWFYPGNSTGHEFIYPRSQATRIAARTGQPVLTTKTEEEISAEAVTDTDLTRIDRGGADTAVDTSNRSTTATAETQTATAQPERTQPAPAPTPETDRTAPATTQTERTMATDRTAQTTPDRTTDVNGDRDNDRTDLPNTAGMLPLLALIGIGSLVGSRMLRRSRRV
jgi:hypothetical protein